MFGPSVTKGFRVPPKSVITIRGNAINARSVLGMDGVAFFRMGHFLEHLTTCGITPDVVEDHELPAGVEACCLPERGSIILSMTTYNAACADEARARFTVIHELGHLALAHTRTFHRDTGQEIKPYEDSEWQADAFAGEFLMPLDHIVNNRISTPERTMMEFGVSWTAAATRLGKLRKQSLIP